MNANQQTAAADVLRFLRALDAAEAVRYEASPRPRPREDVTRSSGGLSDPTADIVLDPVRLELSDEVRVSEDMLARVAEVLRPHTRRLSAVVRRWESAES